MAKIYTIGEILVEIMRETVDCPLDQTGTFRGPYPSGAPAIFISTVAQLGHEAKIWGGVGKDRFGDLILKRLNSDGVDCSDVAVLEGSATAVAFIAYDSSGGREFIYHINGTPAATVNFVSEKFEAPDYFHVMGCSLMASESIQKAINKAVLEFAAKGTKISFDPNLRPELLGSRSIWDVAGIVMENCSIFLPGLDELKLFSSAKSVKESIRELFKKYPSLEIIHLKKGKKGSEIHTRNETIEVQIYPIEKIMKIVDPTGAGDSFDAAFLCAIAEGKTLDEAGRYAAKAGALNSVAFGPMEGKMSEINNSIVLNDLEGMQI